MRASIWESKAVVTLRNRDQYRNRSARDSHGPLCRPSSHRGKPSADAARSLTGRPLLERGDLTMVSTA